jgi:asparagine synthase (glutamine-hydrolysing)
MVQREWTEFDAVKDNVTSIDDIKVALEAAVHRQLMSDVPYGRIAFWRFDSSITSAVAKICAKRIESDESMPGIHNCILFSRTGRVSTGCSPKVADHIGTIHHEIKFTIQEGLDAVKDVIYNLETYDVTTIRASTPMWLMARVIKSMELKWYYQVKEQMNFWRYLFSQSSKCSDFNEETVRKLSKLHMYDYCANKSLAA